MPKNSSNRKALCLPVTYRTIYSVKNNGQTAVLVFYMRKIIEHSARGACRGARWRAPRKRKKRAESGCRGRNSPSEREGKRISGIANGRVLLPLPKKTSTATAVLVFYMRKIIEHSARGACRGARWRAPRKAGKARQKRVPRSKFAERKGG